MPPFGPRGPPRYRQKPARSHPVTWEKEVSLGSGIATHDSDYTSSNAQSAATIRYVATRASYFRAQARRKVTRQGQGGNYWSCDEAGPGRAGPFYLLPWLVYCDSRFGLPLSLISSTLRAQLPFATSLTRG